MKLFRRFRLSQSQVVSVAVLASSLSLAYAAVTIPNFFTSGTTISADQMNANFAAVKSAVDTNTSAITTLQSGSVSKAGDTMTGTLTVPAINWSSPQTHRQLLAMNDFSCQNPSDPGCPGTNDNGRWKASSANTLTLSARLAMPQGAVLSDVWCSFRDESALNADFRVLLRRLTDLGPGWLVLTNHIFTAAVSSGVQTLQASSDPTTYWTTSSLTADNASKALFVSVTLPYDAAAILALQGCYYDYTVSQL